ncbi:MAG: hypothetical protein AAGF12_31350 [Myxococcota bacterium]
MSLDSPTTPREKPNRSLAECDRRFSECLRNWRFWTLPTENSLERIRKFADLCQEYADGVERVGARRCAVSILTEGVYRLHGLLLDEYALEPEVRAEVFCELVRLAAVLLEQLGSLGASETAQDLLEDLSIAKEYVERALEPRDPGAESVPYLRLVR